MIGLGSIFIASKFEDVIPIKLNSLVKDAGHQKFTNEDIINIERDILKTLEY